MRGYGEDLKHWRGGRLMDSDLSLREASRGVKAQESAGARLRGATGGCARRAAEASLCAFRAIKPAGRGQTCKWLQSLVLPRGTLKNPSVPQENHP